jgi:TfoX/Sxy family transcriptional regulator of competence genes
MGVLNEILMFAGFILCMQETDNMIWKKPSEELSQFLEEKIASFNVKKRKMFGCPAYFVNNNMLAGVFQDDIFMHLSEADRIEIRSIYDEAIPFEPIKGRIMKEYVVLPDTLYNNSEKFQEWLNRSYQFVSSLPVKKLKQKK